MSSRAFNKARIGGDHHLGELEMSDAIEAIEAARLSHRPAKVMTLFVGESAPTGGKFFYNGNNAMLTYTRRAIETALPDTRDFFERFKAYGWYLDDLVLTKPVDRLKGAARKAALRNAVSSLSDRIGAYQPQAIVSLMTSITPFIAEAATAAGSDATVYSLPFPGNGHQTRFCDKLARIAPLLPRHSS
ncbi:MULTISPECIES: hypothetical protein [unclassified Bradyrhizobium]|uniref:hypothetical protein n=1 Tax=unclassified Bradyrhizobium TaxID=2631580 RepID=UPI002916833C|nr:MULTISPECIES: hypothetical protein [unclassified Bradyrhizobium]